MAVLAWRIGAAGARGRRASPSGLGVFAFATGGCVRFGSLPRIGYTTLGAGGLGMTTDGEADSGRAGAAARPRRLVVMFVDLAGSTLLMRRDRDGTIDRWQRFVDHVRNELLPALGGRLVRSEGDGLLLTFADDKDAAAGALAMHRRIAELGEGRPPALALALRVSLHAGEVVEGLLDIYGDAPNVTKRLQELARPGETVCTVDVRSRLVEGVDAGLEDLGDCYFKDIDEPLRAYRLGPPAPRAGLPSLEEQRLHELRPTVAVLTFACQSPGEDPDGLLGESLADEVQAQLARSGDVQAIARLSTRALSRRPLTVQEIGHLLGAAFVLSGTYRVLGGRLRLVVALDDARRGRTLWSETFDAGLREALALDGELPHAIAQQVFRALLEQTLERADTQPLPTLASYELLLGAVSLMHRLTARDFERAREQLNLLVGRHPRSAVVHAWRAKWHVLRVAQGWSGDDAADAWRAQDCVKQALDANPRHGLALAIGGLVHAYLRRDLKAAGLLYDDALEANPNEPFAWLFSSLRHAYLGDGGSAAAQCQTALRLSPLDPMKYFFDSLAATALLGGGDWAGGEALSRRSIRANRTHASSWRTLAYALVMQQRMDEAREAVAALRAIEPGYTVGAFRQRFPGRDGPMAEPWARALQEAGLPP